MKKFALIVVSGHGATGKSTLAKKISEKFDIPMVSPDEIKEIMWDNISWEHDKDEWFKFGATSFELMYYFFESMLSKGKSLVAEAHFHPEKNNSRLNNLKNKYGCTLIQVHCNATKEVLEKRFKERLDSENYHQGHKHGIRNIYNEEEFMAHVGHGDKMLDVDGEVMVVDTTDPKSMNYEEIFGFIEKNLKG
jgi:predicted kinase